jgi:hypothetical protein
MNALETRVNRERIVKAMNGWAVLLPLMAILLVDLIAALLQPTGLLLYCCIVVFVVGCIIPFGFFSLQPNEARVLVLFGAYKGTVRASGFHWANPFYSNGPQGFGRLGAAAEGKQGRAKASVSTEAASGTRPRNKVSLRARTLNGEKLKVNDKRGNPIEIAAVVVWRIADTAQAFFDVDDYDRYVPIQSESALRHLANLYTLR